MNRLFTFSKFGSFLIWSLILLFITPGMAQFSRNNTRKSVPYRTNYQRGSSSSGSWHTFEIRDGELWGWGRNEHGQLGDGTTTLRTSPVRIGSASNWVSVVSTSNHSVGLRNDGTLWTWGYNGQGQLGNGTTTGSINPIQVGSDNNWVSIGGGVGHSIALKSNGTLWAWGWNAGGQLGLGDNTNRTTPVQIGTDNNWIFVVAGVQHNLAIKSTGTLWAWGNNNENQLGDGTNTNRNVPTQVGTDNTWIAADGGEHGSIALRANGTLWAWGQNQFGQVGDGSTTARSTPVQVGTDNNWVFISAGQYQNHAIKSTGTLWAWGRNNSGQLGDGSTTNRTSPVQIGSASNWVGVFGGDEFSIGLTSTGRLWSWGANNFGQLGNGTTTNSSNPIEISSQLNHWLMVAGSIWNNHSVALRSNGTIWAWGQNNSGQIGDNTTTDRNSAVQIGTDDTWISVAAGGQHSLGLKSNGTVWAWGLNNNGQIGNNTTTNQTTPIQVGTDNTWISISAGETFSLGLKANGTIWYWGFGSSGNGNGGTTNSLVPVQVGSVTNWANMDAGHQHVHAIKTDGTLWAWGNGGNGQLGTGNSSNQSSPIQIGSATNWNSVSGGTHFTMGLLADGTIQSWGRNANGQLGSGNTTWTNSPNQMGSDNNWILANAGFDWAFGIKSTGTLWGWGNNGNGQLGNGTTTSPNSPVQVDGDNVWTNVSGANNHSIGLKIARNKYCAAGANSNSQLGNGTTTQSTSFSCSPPDPAVPNNVIGASQALCGPQVAANLTGTLPTGCSGSYTYQWSSSTNNSSWTNIAGATGLDLTLGTVSATTYYRRTVSSFGCSSTSSNSVSVTVTFLGNNSIISSQSICTGNAPSTLIGTTPTGGSGVYTYQWESSSDNSTWASNSGSTTINLSPGTLNSNIYFRRLVSGTGCTVITSNSVSISVSALGNNTVSAAQTICQNTATVTLTGATPTGGSGLFTFQWESSSNNSIWASIPGGVFSSYSTGNLGANTYFRRLVISSGCSANSSSVIAITTQNCVPAPRIERIECGAFFSHSICSDSTIRSWGENHVGQLGDNSTTQRNSPVATSGLTSVVATASGAYHTVVLRSNGTVWTYGYNNNGQLGDGTTTNRTAPVQVSGLTGVIAIGAGSFNSYAVLSNGTVRAWGRGQWGGNGDGSTTNRTTPVAVNTLTNIIAVTGGNGHALALRSDGTVWAWGRNGDGQVGDGSNTDRTSPVQISSLSSIIAIGAGEPFSLALRSNGTLMSWGYNNEGELGNGNNSGSNVPVSVSNLTGVVAINANVSGYHTLALRNDGTVWSWGDNREGQLGTGNTTNSNVPVQVPGLSSISRITTGTWHSFVVDVNNNYWTWGRNATGELGNGTTTGSSSPQQITAPCVVIPTVPNNTVSSAQTICIGSSNNSVTGSIPTGCSGTYTYQWESSVNNSSWATISGANQQAYTFGSLSVNTYFRRIASSTGCVASTSASVAMTAQLCVATQRMERVEAGAFFSQSICADSTLNSWGENAFGQLGDNSTTQRNNPVVTSGLTGVVSVASGAYHTLILRSNGTVWAYGYNANGQLGDNTTTNRSTPVQVSGLTGVVAIGAGAYNSYAVLSNGSLRAWGRNQWGANGNGTTTGNVLTPAAVSTLTSGVVAVTGGNGHALALRTDGTVWAWGRNGDGQVGDGTNTDRTAPVQITSLSNIIAIGAGEPFSLALQNNGTVMSWGYNNEGELGNGNNTNSNIPVQVSNLTNIIAIHANPAGYHTLALRSDSTLWSWGDNREGQLGLGNTTNSNVPVQVTGIPSIRWITAGTWHSLVSDPSGNLLSWGINTNGQLGNGTTTRSLSPQNVSGECNVLHFVPNNTLSAAQTICAGSTPATFIGSIPTGCSGTYTYQWQSSTNNSSWTTITNATAQDYNSGSLSVNTYFRRVVNSTLCTASTSASVAVTSQFCMPTQRNERIECGAFFSHSICLDSTIRSWGENHVGQLGDNSTTQRNSPVSTASLTQVVATASGAYHTVVLRSDGTVWAYGFNSNGQLGDGTTLNRTAPVQVFGLTGVIAIGAGSFNSYAVLSNGTVRAWGRNQWGANGNGTTTGNATSPIPVNTLTNIVAVTGGNGHALALRSDGTVWGWGRNGSGQVGDNSTTDRTSPVQITSLSTIIAIGAGESFSLALRSNGTVMSWGYNNEGQLGNGNNTQSNVPVSVSSLTGIVAISANVSGYHNLALRNDGTVWSWGDNREGQLGTGNTTNSNVPVQVPGLPTISRIATGTWHSFVADVNNNLLTWGRNSTGELGNGTTTRSFTPQQVMGACNIFADIQNNFISNSQTICAGIAPSTLTATTPIGCTGLYTYQWESSSNNSSWSNITGVTTANYTPSEITSAVFFRRSVSSFGCNILPSNSVSISVTPAIGNNTLTASQTICSGSTPATLTGSLPTGGDGNYTYQWESSANNNTWSFVLSATNQNFTPGIPSGSTYFRRVVSSGNCLSVASGSVQVQVLPAITMNTITGNQTICTSQTASVLSGSSVSGGTGSYTYQWESSSDDSSWAVVVGASAFTHAPGTLLSTGYFRRVVSSGNCLSVVSGSIRVQVLPAISSNLLAGNQTICSGQSSSLLTGNTPTGGTGSYTFQWASSADENVWTPIVEATSIDLSPGTLLTTTYYRREVGSGGCLVVVSGSIRVQVLPAISQNVITGFQTVCVGVQASVINGSTVIGGNGTYGFQWASSADDIVWNPIIDATDIDISPGTLLTTTYYRRYASSGGCLVVASGSVRVQMLPAISQNIITGFQTVCVGVQPSIVNGSTVLGGNGSYGFQWSSSADNSTWSAVGGGTGQNFNPPVASANVYYRREVSSGSCNSNSSSISISTLAALGDNTIGSSQTLCAPGVPQTLTGSIPSGGTGVYSFDWQTSSNNSTWTAGVGSTVNFIPSFSNSTLYYRRVISSGSCTAHTSAAVVVAFVVGQNDIAASQTIPYNSVPATIIGQTNLNSPGYAWEQSTNNFHWSIISGASNPVFSPGALTQHVWYRRKVAGQGCDTITSAPIRITLNMATDLTLTANSNSPVCAGNSVILHSQGPANATYFWTGPNGYTSALQNPSINMSTESLSGVYRVRSTAPNGDTAFVTVNVVVGPSISGLQINYNNPVCAGSTLTLSAGNFPRLAYLWNGPNAFTSSTAVNDFLNSTTNMSGIYTVQVTSPGCESITRTLNVVVNGALNPAAGSAGPVCAGGAVSLTSVYVAGASVVWSGPNGFSSTLQNPTIANAQTVNSGVYTVTMSGLGCSPVSQTVSQLVNASTSNLAIISNGPVCAGNTLALSIPAFVNSNYTWLGPNGFTGVDSNILTRTNAQLNFGGMYTLSANIPGCGIVVRTINVTVAPAFVSTIGSNSPVCIGNAISLSNASVVGGTYSWSGPNGFTSSLQSPTISNTQTIHSGVYTITLNHPGCGTASYTTTVQVNGSANAAILSSNSPACVSSTISLTASAVPNATYSWTGPNGYTSSGSQVVSRTNAQLNFAGVYTVSILVPGCGTVLRTNNVIVAPSLVSTIGSNSPVCIGSALSLTNASVVGATYNWSGPNGFTSSLQSPTISNAQTIHSGVYTITINHPGCGTASYTTTVQVNGSANTAILTSNSPVCVSNTLSLTASAIPNATYSWTGPNGYTASGSEVVSRTNAQLNFAGGYAVSIAVPGCGTTTRTANIVVAPALTSTIGSNSPVCVGNVLSLTNAAISGAIFSWSGPNGFTSSLQSPTLSNVQSVNTGIYTLTLNHPGCGTASFTTSVQVNSSPSTAVLTNNSPVCSGNTISLTATNLPNASYSWNGPLGFTGTGNIISRPSAQVTHGGNYDVTISIPGCGSANKSIKVIVLGNNVVVATSSSAVVCEGTAVYLYASSIPGATYLWTGPNGYTSGFQNPSISNIQPNQAGIYTVFATQGFCGTSSSTVSLAVSSRPSSTTVSVAQAICVPAPLTLTGSNIAGATLSWAGPGGFTASGSTFTKASTVQGDAGVYTYTVTTTACGSAVRQVNVTITNPGMVSGSVYPNPVCTGSVLYLNSGFISGATYNWSGPAGFNVNAQNTARTQVSNLMAGVYTLTVNVPGCGAVTQNFPVVVNTCREGLFGNEEETPAAVALGQLSFRLYPNPTEGKTQAKLRVEAGNENAEYQLQVLDVLGHVVLMSGKQVQANGEITWDLDFSQLARGVYLVKLSGEGVETIERVVVR